jgi:type II secretory ATPase GspE/PulE/Tfp pilus assembly ATPase PilB-like protein
MTTEQELQSMPAHHQPSAALAGTRMRAIRSGDHPQQAQMATPLELPDFANTVFTGGLSEFAETAQPDFGSFYWPVPQSALYSKPELWTEPQACDIVGLNGNVGRCSLVSLAPQEKTIVVQIERANTPVELSFSQFRQLTLVEPLTIQRMASDEDFPEIHSRSGLYAFEVHWQDGSIQTGRTLGYVETGNGLFIFEPLDDKGSLQRSFIPQEAFVNVTLSDPVKSDAKSATTGVPKANAFGADAAALSKTAIIARLTESVVSSPEQLMQALDRQSKLPMIRVGEALTGLGFVTQSQIEKALALQTGGETVQPLGEVLIGMGVLTRRDLNTALARKMGYPVVNVSEFPVEHAALRRVPLNAARRLMVLPLLARSGLTVVALVDPTRRRTLEELEFLTRGRVIATLGNEKQILPAITAAYERLGLSDGQYDDAPTDSDTTEETSTNELLESMELQHQGRETPEEEGQLIAESDNTLVRLINTMIIEASNRGVSDIHVECRPRQAKVRIRFRKDGLLMPYLELPHTYRSALVARLKIMADLDISERRKPQDGKIDFRKFSAKHRLELRIATIPTSAGLEDVVMRLLSSAKPLPMDKLGLSPDNFDNLRTAVTRPYGMVLCVGPTGSGKTTTLHSVLDFVNTPERKIWTAEDPIEISQPALRQVQVNPKIDWTFAKALRSFLRADPDIIMVGEIRDVETAKIAIEASLTGHLLLSTLHTNSAAETVTRLIDMGMDPFNFADSLLAVLAQRLARRFCTHCRTSEPATKAQVEELLDNYLHIFPEEFRPTRQYVLNEWLTHYGQDGQLQYYKGTGCNQCRGSGMSGRVGLHELMSVTPALRRMIQVNARAEDLVTEAFRSGQFRTLRQDGILKVLAGLTSMDEVRANSNA